MLQVSGPTNARLSMPTLHLITMFVHMKSSRQLWNTSHVLSRKISAEITTILWPFSPLVKGSTRQLLVPQDGSLEIISSVITKLWRYPRLWLTSQTTISSMLTWQLWVVFGAWSIMEHWPTLQPMPLKSSLNIKGIILLTHRISKAFFWHS